MINQAAKRMREENIAYRQWYIEVMIPYWRDVWPLIQLKRFEKPYIWSRFI